MNASGDRSLQQALLLPMNEVDLKWPPAVSGESSMPSHNGDGSRVNNNSTDENKLSVMEFTSTAEVAPTRTTVPQSVATASRNVVLPNLDSFAQFDSKNETEQSSSDLTSTLLYEPDQFVHGKERRSYSGSSLCLSSEQQRNVLAEPAYQRLRLMSFPAGLGVGGAGAGGGGLATGRTVMDNGSASLCLPFYTPAPPTVGRFDPSGPSLVIDDDDAVVGASASSSGGGGGSASASDLDFFLLPPASGGTGGAVSEAELGLLGFDFGATQNFDLVEMGDCDSTKVKSDRKRHMTAPCSLLSNPQRTTTTNQPQHQPQQQPQQQQQQQQQQHSSQAQVQPQQRRRSRGKPDSIFSLLRKNGMTDGSQWSRARSYSLRHIDSQPLAAAGSKGKSDESLQRSGAGSTSASAGRRNSRSSAAAAAAASKFKPLPLVIPPHVFFNRFQSQLRSPTISESSFASIFGVPARTPYTPPPILSPLRKGSGLFCRVHRPCPAQPKSAPATGFGRESFWDNPNLNALIAAAGYTTSDCVSPAIPSPPDSPVKTDSLPHINVGNEYQAVIPPMDLSTDDRPEDRETLVFDPKCLENVTDAELNALLKLANSPAVLGGGLNSELAWHLLYDCGGNVKEAALRLLNSENPFPEGHPLHSCNYPDVHMWSPEEIETFETALLKFDKDFNEISKKVKTKSVQQCISFYYSWKTLFKKSYRKYRRTKQQREYLELGMKRSLRSCSPTATEQNSNSNSTTSSVAMATIAEATNSGTGTGTAIDNAMGTSPTVSETVIAPTLSVTAMEVEQQQQQPHCSNSSNGAVTATAAAAAAAGSADIYVSPMHFSCKFCGKVFSKVKSRNAHMKVHYRDLREHPPSTS
ncbi:Transcriptional-regulating factor 1 [Trichinella pseudospiralis]|uniref:Transcriptional-regulating factor 1 n=1 Tax=Trichinella pseudospiralis TaxID=6337 RepID=A0A0V1FHY7_TRIPS|nr:Transcriptional-regulating factor 1 [Trichinella pseudospiralis]